MLMRFSHVIHFQRHSNSSTKSYAIYCALRRTLLAVHRCRYKPDAKTRCECLFSRERLPYPEHPACSLGRRNMSIS